MSIRRKNMLYLCADRGIPFGGTKGAAIHVREFLEAAVKADYSPTVLTAARDTAGGYAATFPVHTTSQPTTDSFVSAALKLGADRKVLREVNDFQRNQPLEQALSEIYENRPFDFIYERYSLFSTAGRSFARAAGLPFVLEVNAPLVLEAARYRQLALAELARSVELYLFSTADHIVTVSEQLKTYIHGIAPGAAVSVIPNGVNVESFTKSCSGTGWRKRLTKNPDTDFVVGFVGSVKPWHGVEVLIEAMGRLIQTDKQFSLCVVGNGDKLRSKLEEQCSAVGLGEHVTFTGSIPHEEIPAVLHSMDALVAPYPDLPDFYFSPLKLFEYMAAAKPIVASAVGQVAEVLTNEENGLLVKPGDCVSLTEALVRLKDDPGLGMKLGSAALSDAKHKHTWSIRMSQVTQIIETLEPDRSKVVKKRHAV